MVMAPRAPAQQFSVYFDEELVALVKDEARRQKTSAAAVIRQACEQHLRKEQNRATK